MKKKKKKKYKDERDTSPIKYKDERDTALRIDDFPEIASPTASRRVRNSGTVDLQMGSSQDMTNKWNAANDLQRPPSSSESLGRRSYKEEGFDTRVYIKRQTSSVEPHAAIPSPTISRPQFSSLQGGRPMSEGTEYRNSFQEADNTPALLAKVLLNEENSTQNHELNDFKSQRIEQEQRANEMTERQLGQEANEMTDALKLRRQLGQEANEMTVHMEVVTRKLQIAESRLSEKVRELDQVKTLLQERTRQLSKMEKLVDSREEHIAHAKEMWMLESSRAARLGEQLAVSQQRIADLEKNMISLKEDYQSASKEIRQLKLLFNQQDGFIPSQPNLNNSFNSRGIGFGSPKDHSISYNEPLKITTLHNISYSSEEKLGGGYNSCNENYSQLTNHDRYRQLCLCDDAVLFEDDVLQIGIKSSYVGLECRIAVFYGNKSKGHLQSFRSKFSFKSGEGALDMTVGSISDFVSANQQVVQRISCRCVEAYEDCPMMELKFLLPDNSPRIVQLRLPVVVTKFMEAREIGAEDFFTLWNNEVFSISETACVTNLAKRFCGSLVHIAKCLQLGGALAVLCGVDASPSNFVVCGQFPKHDADPSIPISVVLARLEVGSGQYTGQARLAVRSDSQVLASAIRLLIATQVAVVSNEAC
eukprot:GHVL01040858.1.p1 GENE.GHVL01040858.1~~GHVL01040858.1.p1  ORF type:complete len:646 (+),score=107.32 GHVL01040858.1:243-2180(+)